MGARKGDCPPADFSVWQHGRRVDIEISPGEGVSKTSFGRNLKELTDTGFQSEDAAIGTVAVGLPALQT